MVRYYTKKMHGKYTADALKQAVDDVKEGRMTASQASKHHGVPRMTIFDHVSGKRSKVTAGRPTSIPLEDEEELVRGLKCMEKWGLGLTRKEVLEVVGEFVRTNNMETVFKDGVPGEDWFLAFKKRHNLSIKKPQNVEYARRKMTDPFVIREYFDLLENTLKELSLLDKPEQIWNLDETSFCLDPSKTGVVGGKGLPSTRVTSGPGRDNTTVLAGCSATGVKAPPLIVFKAASFWSGWTPDPGEDFPGTSYTSAEKGWMTSEVFNNYLKKTFIPAVGSARPVLLIYDGHSTHVDVNVVLTALENGITILKLPPHTSHLLQPLDLAVFKSLKTSWDSRLVKWQRQHRSVKLPKKDFAIILGKTWQEASPEIILSGFRKAGIYPLNKSIIPDSVYEPEALLRFQHVHVNPAGLDDVESESMVQIITASGAPGTQVQSSAAFNDSESGIQRLPISEAIVVSPRELSEEIGIQSPTVPEEIGIQAPTVPKEIEIQYPTVTEEIGVQPPIATEIVIQSPTVSEGLEIQLEQSNDDSPDGQNEIRINDRANAQSSNLSVGSERTQTTAIDKVRTNFEFLLLDKVKPCASTQKNGRKRIAEGAEVITSTDAIKRLKELEDDKRKKLEDKKKKLEEKNKKAGERKKQIEEKKRIRELRKLPRTRDPKKRQPAKKNKWVPDTSEEVSEDEQDSDDENSEDAHSVEGEVTEPHPQLDDVDGTSDEVDVGKWVLVTYKSTRNFQHHCVGKVIKKNHRFGEPDWEVQFLKFEDGKFVWPLREDIDTISNENIVRVLRDPAVGRRGLHMFDEFEFVGLSMK